jgi:SAM-dependent methyltransferase
MYRRHLGMTRLAAEAVKVLVQPLREMRSYPTQKVYADHIGFTRAYRRYSSEQLSKWRAAGLLQRRACPLCGTADGAERFVTPAGNRYSQCPSCSFVYMDPAPTPEAYNAMYESGYDGLIAEWEQTKELNGQSDFMINSWFSLDILRRHKPGGRFLDFGCGDGWVLKLAKAHYDVFGIDINPAQLDRARENVPEGTFFQVDIAQDLPGELVDQFDIIHSNQNLEHLLRPRKFVSQFHRMLRKDGLLLIACPNVDSLGFDIFGAQDNMATLSHVSLFSPETMSRMLESEGFRVIERASYGMDVYAFDYWMYKLNPHPEVFEHQVMFTRFPLLTFLVGLPLWIAAELYFYSKMLRMNERFGCYFYCLAQKV